jgi:pantoate--beta-alanine ligase
MQFCYIHGMSQPAVLNSIATLRAFVQARRVQGQRIALVPTMGALHDGHLELVRQGLAHAECVIVSIFVNPSQFGPNEDFSAYPRTWEEDKAKLEGAGAQAIFHPAVEEMYPSGAATSVIVRGLTDALCGPIRPGHFEGVATIVTKLLLQALPDYALFGEKDYQQLQVIRRLTADLDIPVEIIGVPTVRDVDGLALSSRNIYLSPQERDIARRLNKILFGMAGEIRSGKGWDRALSEGQGSLMQAGFDSIDYLDVRDAETLAMPIPDQRDRLRILAAVRLGRTRLIDNVGI